MNKVVSFKQVNIFSYYYVQSPLVTVWLSKICRSLIDKNTMIYVYGKNADQIWYTAFQVQHIEHNIHRNVGWYVSDLQY